MGRKKSKFWDYAEELKDSRFRCNFCKRDFAGGASRITAHLAGEKGNDIAICSEVPQDVKKRATEEIPSHNKKRKIAPPSSSNVEENGTIFSQSIQEGAHIPSGDVPPTTALAGQTTDIRNDIEEAINAMKKLLFSEDCPPDGEQVTNHNSHSSNGHVPPTTALPGQTTHVRNIVEEVTSNAIMTGKDMDRKNRGGRKKSELWEHVEHFKDKDNRDKIRCNFCKHEFSAVAARIIDHFAGKTGDVAICSRVPQDVKRRALEEISRRHKKPKIAPPSSNNVEENNVEENEAILSQPVLEGAHIPSALPGSFGSPLVGEQVTHPNSHLSNGDVLPTTLAGQAIANRNTEEDPSMVTADPMIESFPRARCPLDGELNENEAWNLFVDKFGHDIPLEVRGIARSIAKECAGLPLGIITVAGSMRGMDIDIHGWRNTLEELKHSKEGLDDMENEVFGVLKFSYNILKEDLQQCFLYCSLYPEDFKIKRDDLIKNLIDEGIIERKQSRQAEFDKGHAMLNKLEDSYLLERVAGYKNENEHVKMHDLLRDMAIQIAQARHGFMVEAGMEAGKRLEDLPHEEKWKEDLVRVSLMSNAFTKIPSNALRGCPKLSTLMLNNNIRLETIPNDFFVHMPGLKVLNLSYTNIEYLPDSVFNLENLTALVLIKCDKLKHVNSLEKLTALRRLELVYAGIKEIPQGLEMLVNLRHLNLHLNNLTIFPSGILPKLSHLQHLEFSGQENIYIEVNCFLEVESLKKLETFKCQFTDIRAFNTCVRSLEKVRPSNYELKLGSKSYYGCLDGKEVILVGCVIREDDPLRDVLRGKVKLLLPKDTQFLNLREMNHLRRLCELPFLNMLVDLKKLVICNCGEISLFDVPRIPFLKSIEVLELTSLRNPSLLAAPSRPPPGTFSQLKVFDISFCVIIKTLFAPWLLQYLHNLEELTVYHCSSLVKIIGELSDEEDDEGMDTTISPLPKLRLMKLRELHKLKSICSSSQLMVCDSIQQIEIINCQRLKRLPLSLPFLNGQLCPPPSLYKIEAQKKWWESLEWDHPYSKTVLQSFVEYSLFPLAIAMKQPVMRRLATKKLAVKQPVKRRLAMKKLAMKQPLMTSP